MRAKTFLNNLWNDQRGQSTTEYILILAVVVMIASKFKGLLNERIGRAMDSLGSNMDSALNNSN